MFHFLYITGQKIIYAQVIIRSIPYHRDLYFVKMDNRLIIFFCLLVIISAMALPTRDEQIREKRDVMESMKNAWSEVVKTLSDAGDAVVHVFKPTEKSVLTKMSDGIKDLTK